MAIIVTATAMAGAVVKRAVHHDGGAVAIVDVIGCRQRRRS